MTGNWFLYAFLIGGLLTLAAWQAARSASRAGRASRWIWLIAGLATIAIPLKALLLPVVAPRPVLPLGPQWNWPVAALSNGAEAAAAVAVPVGTAGFDPADLILPVWGLLSLGTLCWLALSYRSLARSRRTWSRGTLPGKSVLVSEDFGPAVVGLWRPVIVVPQWVLSLSPQQSELVLLHEGEHLAAGDSRLLCLMSVLLVITPWQPFLWLQLSGLRLAIECDCDRRVVARADNLRAYAELLLSLAGRIPDRRQHAWALPLATYWPARSALEQRIRELTAPPSRWVAAFAAVGGITALSIACAANPPAAAPAEQSTVMTAQRDSSDEDRRDQEQHQMEALLAANFDAPVTKAGRDNTRIYWIVTELDGTVVRKGEGRRDLIWWSPAAFQQRWPPKRGMPPIDGRKGAYVLTNEEIFKRFPDLDRNLHSYGLSPMAFGADSVMVVWGSLYPVIRDSAVTQ